MTDEERFAQIAVLFEEAVSALRMASALSPVLVGSMMTSSIKTLEQTVKLFEDSSAADLVRIEKSEGTVQ